MNRTEQRRKSLARALLPAVLVVASLSPAGAATSTTTFNVSLTVTASCTVSATGLAFGSTGVFTANIDASSTITVTCSNTTPYNVGLDVGTGAGATVAARKMTSGGNTATYTTYQNAGRTTVWGNTVGTDTVSGTGNGSAQAITVYGRVPLQATPAAGSYTDTITVTVTY